MTRTLTVCDVCVLTDFAGPHGLAVGNPSMGRYGSVLVSGGRYAATMFSSSVYGFLTPFDPELDRTFTFDAAGTGMWR